ncbi:MAG: RdgB/HAM1 family non-canonical purine NTP pyrophosphatase, partial [Firmicutes bacterium]|nr:RdgB/HAM1 family non-canonical purine NTP pyrophosphatase [Bacillota bacterium]
GYSFTARGLKEVPAIVIPPEDGDTFVANAIIKAKAAAQQSGLIAIADDSGICVDALDGAPGIYSARFAADEGADHIDSRNNEKLLRLLKDVPDEQRGGHFACAIAIATPEGEVRTVEGRVYGVIAHEESGEGGFGYDPLFFVPELNKTLSQVTAEEKNAISHRGQALRLMLPILAEMLAD